MTTSTPDTRYAVADLTAFAGALFVAAGCDADKSATLSHYLVEADLLGHTTHGLQLASAYLAELEAGTMTARGEPEVVADRKATVTWDGNRLPGVWLTAKAVALAVERAPAYGVVTVVIRNSHHIACLATFLEYATSRGLMITIASSDPAVASVAPFGGRKPVYTPDPIAIGIPTHGDPILIDISASITTNGMANRLRRKGKHFPGAWALDANGTPTTDPEALFTKPPGSLLPVGGVDHGHKGYGLALMIEALTQGLSGFGRANSPSAWGASVFVQVTDPEAFAGRDAFREQTDWLASACRAVPPVPGNDAVRLPGERALTRKRDALAHGVPLYAGILTSLEPFATKYGVAVPTPVA